MCGFSVHNFSRSTSKENDLRLNSSGPSIAAKLFNKIGSQEEKTARIERVVGVSMIMFSWGGGLYGDGPNRRQKYSKGGLTMDGVYRQKVYRRVGASRFFKVFNYAHSVDLDFE